MPCCNCLQADTSEIGRLNSARASGVTGKLTTSRRRTGRRRD